MKNKKKIALVNQRYGLEVNGGSEYYTRQLAEHLLEAYEVEVLTTKALDYGTWENYYQEDTAVINHITVRRFSIEKPRKIIAMKVLERLRRYVPVGKEYFENKWIDAQGPYCPELISYIERHAGEYEAVIFVTYLYYHSVRGIQNCSGRFILLPTAHDEPYIYFCIYKEIFEKVKALIYLTPEEKKFAEKLFDVKQKPSCVCGAGIEIPEKVDSNLFREKFKIDRDYLIYAGRIDESKGCKEMFRIFQEYKKRNPQERKMLVLMGKAAMQIPKDPDILELGFVSEEDKFNGIRGAEALWLPSKYESLSIAVLEALALGVPVLVNGVCEVLKGHCKRSGAGVYYCSDEEAVRRIADIVQLDNRKEISEKARQYIKENYQWSRIIQKIENVIEEIQ